MGMSRAEVRSRFDEIVEFSGLEKLPRHAGEALLERHVHATGVLGRRAPRSGNPAGRRGARSRRRRVPEEVPWVEWRSSAEAGRTVLFVSHSMPSVLRLCPRVVLLDGGKVVADGTSSSVVEEYMGRGQGGAIREWTDLETAPGDEHIRLSGVRVCTDAGLPTPEFDIRQTVVVEIDYWNLSDSPEFRPTAYIHVRNGEGVLLFASWDQNNPEWRGKRRQHGLVRTRCVIPGNFFAEGGVFVTAGVSSQDPVIYHAEENDAVVFHIVDRSEGDGVRGASTGEFPGVLRPMLNWTVQEDAKGSAR